MGLKSSTLLQEEDIEELQNETGCRLNVLCERLLALVITSNLGLNKAIVWLLIARFFLQFLQIKSKDFTADLQVLTNQRKEHWG